MASPTLKCLEGEPAHHGAVQTNTAPTFECIHSVGVPHAQRPVSTGDFDISPTRRPLGKTRQSYRSILEGDGITVISIRPKERIHIITNTVDAEYTTALLQHTSDLIQQHHVDDVIERRHQRDVSHVV